MAADAAKKNFLPVQKNPVSFCADFPKSGFLTDTIFSRAGKDAIALGMLRTPEIRSGGKIHGGSSVCPDRNIQLHGKLRNGKMQGWKRCIGAVQGKVCMNVSSCAVWDKMAVHRLQIGIWKGEEKDRPEDAAVIPPVIVSVGNASHFPLIVDGHHQPVSLWKNLVRDVRCKWREPSDMPADVFSIQKQPALIGCPLKAEQNPSVLLRPRIIEGPEVNPGSLEVGVLWSDSIPTGGNGDLLPVGKVIVSRNLAAMVIRAHFLEDLFAEAHVEYIRCKVPFAIERNGFSPHRPDQCRRRDGRNAECAVVVRFQNVCIIFFHGSSHRCILLRGQIVSLASIPV
ncbi:MAG: hypothetical protein LKG89_09710 [Lachnospiraceae bacterium]|nr:hypothetical protein [Lachnospiraceae bacterium]